MPLSKRELMLLERAERAGTKVNWSALDREFNFTLSGIVTTGVDFSLFVQLCESVSSIAESQNFVCELEGIVVFPIITDPTIIERNDFITHKRKDRGYFVGKNVDFTAWARARKAGRISLAVENLKSSVLSIPDRHLSSENKNILIEMIDMAAQRTRKK